MGDCPYLDKSTCQVFDQKDSKGIINTQICNYWYDYEKCPIYKILKPFINSVCYFRSLLESAEKHKEDYDECNLDQLRSFVRVLIEPNNREYLKDVNKTGKSSLRPL